MNLSLGLLYSISTFEPPSCDTVHLTFSYKIMASLIASRKTLSICTIIAVAVTLKQAIKLPQHSLLTVSNKQLIQLHG
jgi:hypothetical protein